MAKDVGIESGLLRISNVNLKYNGHEIEMSVAGSYIGCFSLRTTRLKYVDTTGKTNWYQILPKNN